MSSAATQKVKESLLRPLSAQLLDPTAPEISGLVDRNKLLGIFGRGRKSQMALADQMGLKEIPTPAGGCKLAEKENSRRYWPVLTRLKEPTVEDFELSNIGRQYWFGDHWLSMGRNEADNSALERLVRPGDAILRVRDFPSPFALARQLTPWDNETLQDAASLVASYSPKGVRAAEASPDGTIAVRVRDQRREHLRQCGAQAHPRPSVGRARIRRCPQSHQGGEPAHV